MIPAVVCSHYKITGRIDLDAAASRGQPVGSALCSSMDNVRARQYLKGIAWKPCETEATAILGA